MLFTELRELKKLVEKLNRQTFNGKVEFFNPHMYMDGQWAVAIIFGKVPILYDVWDIVANCYYHGHHAFWGQVQGKITLFVQ